MLWWASANLTLAAAIPLVATPNLSLASIVVAITLLNITPALVWASARACNGRGSNRRGRRRRRRLARQPSPCPSSATRWMSMSPSTSPSSPTFLFAAAFEFWRGRNEQLTARWPLIVLLVLHGLFCHRRRRRQRSRRPDPGRRHGPAELARLRPLRDAGLRRRHLDLHRGDGAREQELLHKIDATTDALTGVATRRAFYEDAERILAASRETGMSVSVILFDLDRFKAINDTYGHGPGDEVLRVFGADLAQDAARQRPDRPPRRRGVRGPAARRQHGGRLSGRRAHPRRLHRRLRRNRRFHGDAQRRHRPGGRQFDPRFAAQGRRPGALPRQVQRPRPRRGCRPRRRASNRSSPPKPPAFAGQRVA